MVIYHWKIPTSIRGRYRPPEYYVIAETLQDALRYLLIELKQLSDDYYYEWGGQYNRYYQQYLRCCKNDPGTIPVQAGTIIVDEGGD